MAEGDVLYAPGTWDRSEPGEIEILASYAHLHQKGVTLKSGQGFLPAGTPIGPEAGTGLFVVADGTTVTADGVLRLSVNTGDSVSEHRKLGNIVLSGILKVDSLPGADATARAATAAAIATALGGRVDDHRRELHY